MGSAVPTYAGGDTNLPRLRVVMDLDECMVHSVDLLEHVAERSKFMMMSELHREKGAVIIEDFAVYVRPHLEIFLEGITEFADVYAYTAGTKGYASHVFKHIDPERTIFQKILYRHNCVPAAGPLRSFLIPLKSKQRQYLKDLRKFGDEVYIPERTVLVDNNPISFTLQPSNGLLVPDFIAHPSQSNDTSLLEALEKLKQMSREPDVRTSVHATRSEHM